MPCYVSRLRAWHHAATRLALQVCTPRLSHCVTGVHTGTLNQVACAVWHGCVPLLLLRRVVVPCWGQIGDLIVDSPMKVHGACEVEAVSAKRDSFHAAVAAVCHAAGDLFVLTSAAETALARGVSLFHKFPRKTRMVSPSRPRCETHAGSPLTVSFFLLLRLLLLLCASLCLYVRWRGVRAL